MKWVVGFLCANFLGAGLAHAQIDEISAERMRAHVRFLASDLLEGRGVGTRGGDLAAEYMATQFALAGLKPAGDNGTWYQKFTLVGSTPQAATAIYAEPTRAGGKNLSFQWLDEFVGVSLRQQPAVAFDGEAVFVGHGITAPEYQWDDYKGVDVRGKVVVLFTGEPPSNDPKFFTGEALTYYGRWSYKYEEATRRGAAGAIIIHTTPTASYGWNVVRSSWSTEDLANSLAPGQYALGIAAWVTTEAGQKIAASVGKSVEDLLKMADARGFQAVPLPLRFRVKADAKIRQIETRNVIGKVEGSDPGLRDQAVLFSAHWDHLGIGEAINGDNIYNGASDNATGCAILLEIARAWAGLQQKTRRSAVFVSVAAEEGGLLGSEYYGKHPVVPAGKTALALNYDSYLAMGRMSDVQVRGAERTTIFPIVDQAARRYSLALAKDPTPAAGLYYRSDHFSFARVGIPSFSIDKGTELAGTEKGAGPKAEEEYYAKRYHQPSDQYNDNWNLSDMETYARFGMLINMNVANQPAVPTWNAGDEFLPARVASGVK
ncbi:MAG: M28 family peptidase [Bryobacteraceae bacterium]